MPRVELVLANGIEECFFVYFKLHFRAMTKDFWDYWGAQEKKSLSLSPK